MRDEDKTKAQLISELRDCEYQADRLEALELAHSQLKEELHRANEAAEAASHRVHVALSETERLFQAARAILGATNLEDICQQLLSHFSSLVGADRITLFLVDQERREILLNMASGSVTGEISITYDELEAGISGMVFRSRQPVLSSSPEDQVEPEATYMRRMKDNAGSLIVVPLVVQDTSLVIGTITAINRLDQRAFTQHDVDLLTTLASQAATAIENIRLLEAAQQEIVERKQVEGALHFVAQQGWKLKGHEFLDILVEYLGKTLGVAYAFVDEFVDSRQDRVHTLALSADHEIAKNIEYDLKDTPCDNVIGKALCSYPQGVQEIFPRDTLLTQMEAEGYVGIPLWDSAGKPLGLIAVVSRDEIQNPQLVETVLQIVAVRATHVIEQLRSEQTLRESEQRFRRVVTDQTDLISRWSPSDGVRSFVNASYCQHFGKSEAEMLDSSIFDLALPEEYDASREQILAGLRALTPDNPIVVDEYRGIAADGKLHIYEWRDRAFFDEDGQIVEVQSVGRDITEHKQAETALQKAIDNLAVAQKIAKLGSWEWDVSTSNIYWSDEMYQVYGISKDTPPSVEAVRGMIHPDDSGIFDQAMADTFAGNAPEYIEYRIVTTKGEERVIRAQANTVYDASGQLVQMVGTAQDITERKKMEQEREQLLIAEREQRLLAETLAEATLSLTSHVNLPAVLDEILGQVQRLVPYSAANIALMEGDILHVARWKGYDICGGEEFVSTLTQPLTRFQIDAEAIQIKKPIAIPDALQDPRWVAMNETAWIRSHLVMPIYHHERVLGVLRLDGDVPGKFTSNDADRLQPLIGVTAIALENAQLYEGLEQRVAERTSELASQKAQTETILQSVADAIVFTDRDANILYVNPAWEALTGYTRHEAIGKNPNFLQTSKTPFEAYQDMWQTILAGNIWRGILCNKRKDGTEYDAELTIAPVKDASGEAQNFVGIQRDVTEERQLAALKERFIADAAHDLGNPVALFRMNLHLLRKQPEKQAHYIAQLDNATTRLENLIKDLLTLLRLDQGAFDPTLMPVDLATLVEQVVDVHQPMANEKAQRLTFELQGKIPTIMADNQQLERVVVNLLSNALRYTPEDGEIRVSLTLDAMQVILAIQDSGIGIATKELPHIFDRFHRSNEAKQIGAGTGLGLSIAKEIVELHNGKVDVSSQPGEGSQFTVYLPIKD